MSAARRFSRARLPSIRARALADIIKEILANEDVTRVWSEQAARVVVPPKPKRKRKGATA